MTVEELLIELARAIGGSLAWFISGWGQLWDGDIEEVFSNFLKLTVGQGAFTLFIVLMFLLSIYDSVKDWSIWKKLKDWIG